MHKLLAITIIALSLSASGALAQVGCGIPPIPPIPPIGCRAMQPQCVCDASGHCEWTFLCVR